MNKRPKVLGIHDDGKLKIIGIYDDEKSIDRYTVVYNQVEREIPGKNGHMVKLYAAVGMNAAPFHPQGFGQHCTAMLGRHLGKKISFEQLPDDCRKLVLRDLADE